MTQTFLETSEDMKWLSDVHVRAAKKYKFAVLTGNEDCPEKIELYVENDIRCTPTVYEYDGEHYRLVSLGRQDGREKFVPHVGMNYVGRKLSMFTFQLLGKDGFAQASIDFDNGVVSREMILHTLDDHKAAIIRLARIYLKLHQAN